MPPSFLSLRPSEFVAGGLIDDINATITDAKFTMYDYNGKADVSVPALGIELELEDGVKHESYYSAGDAKYWAPSADGKNLIPTGDKTSLTNGCKLGIFLTELVMAGFPEDKLAAGDISCLTGLVAHFQRKADKERKGLIKKEGDSKEASTLCVTKIITMPGEKVAKAAKPAVGQPAAAKTAAAPATKAAAAAATAVDIDDDIVPVVMEIVTANGNSVTKNKLPQLAFKAIGKDHPLFAQRTAITQRVASDEFLKMGADQALWAFDGTTVTME